MYLVRFFSHSFRIPSKVLLKRKLSILFLIFLFVIGGGYFTYEGLKIEIKGKVAQILLQRSWHQTIKNGKKYQPWSSFDGVPIMRLTIPQHNINQIVLKGTSGQALAFGPSFHEESFLPQEEKVTIISSHRDSHGDYIKKLKFGEKIILQDENGNWHTYIINDFFTINVKKETFTIKTNEQRLLLVTCFPFNSLQSGTPFRYVVSARKHLI